MKVMSDLTEDLVNVYLSKIGKKNSPGVTP
jgi:hypothetical protein